MPLALDKRQTRGPGPGTHMAHPALDLDTGWSTDSVATAYFT